MTGDDLGLLHNRTFDDLSIGDSAAMEQTLGPQGLQLPAHLRGHAEPPDEDLGCQPYGSLGSAFWGEVLVGSLLGTRLPGPGTVHAGCKLRGFAPVKPGNRLQLRIEVTALEAATRRVTVIASCCRHLVTHALSSSPTRRSTSPRTWSRRPTSLPCRTWSVATCWPSNRSS